MPLTPTARGRITLDGSDPANAAAFAQDRFYRGGPGVGFQTWNTAGGQPIASQLPRAYGMQPGDQVQKTFAGIPQGVQQPNRQSAVPPAGTQPQAQMPQTSPQGITTGPVIGQPTVNYHANNLRNTSPTGPPNVANNSALSQHLQDLMGGNMQRAATDFNTQAAYNNAQQGLRSQQAADQAARGQYGVDASSYLSQLTDQTNVFQMILQSLGGMTPSMSNPNFGLASLALG